MPSNTETLPTTTPTIRIHLLMKDGPLPRSIQQVLNLPGKQDFVDSPEKADLVIVNDVDALERAYNKDQYFAFIRTRDAHPEFPDNVRVVNVSSLLVELCHYICAVAASAKPITSEGVGDDDGYTCTAPEDAMTVLVIDDKKENIRSARKGLGQKYRLTTVTGYREAMELLRKETFDVVLTDLHMPMSSRTLSAKAFRLGEEVPYGLLLMIEAAHMGAKYVAIVTDLNHHDDPLSAAFDHFSSYAVRIHKAHVRMLHARVCDGVKNWEDAMMRVMANETK